MHNEYLEAPAAASGELKQKPITQERSQGLPSACKSSSSRSTGAGECTGQLLVLIVGSPQLQCCQCSPEMSGNDNRKHLNLMTTKCG